MNKYSHLDPKDPEATTGEGINKKSSKIFMMGLGT